jgi:hypothetical protein
MILMYSQHSDAFEEMVQNYYFPKKEWTDKMKTFYGDIINGVNGSYVLK